MCFCCCCCRCCLLGQGLVEHLLRFKPIPLLSSFKRLWKWEHFVLMTCRIILVIFMAATPVYTSRQSLITTEWRCYHFPWECLNFKQLAHAVIFLTYPLTPTKQSVQSRLRRKRFKSGMIPCVCVCVCPWAWVVLLPAEPQMAALYLELTSAPQTQMCVNV